MRLLITVPLALCCVLLGQNTFAQCIHGPTHKLYSDDHAWYDRLGQSVAVSGTTAIVGAPGDDGHGHNTGAAYLFNTVTGTQTGKIVPDDGSEDDFFARSAAISGTTAIFGSYLDDDHGLNSGSAYLYDTASLGQIAKLLPVDGDALDWFGYSVAISGSTAIVSATGDDDNGSESGSAYVIDAVTGSLTAKLLPEDGAAEDRFGRSVGVSGTTAIVGAPHNDDNGSASGSAYLFHSTSGKQITKLLSDDGAEGDLFGTSVAISGTTAVVGAYGDDDNGYQSGSAYLFDVETGVQTAKLLPGDGDVNDHFGVSVAISGSIVIVGAYRDEVSGDRSGSAYLFDAATGARIAKLLADDGNEHDWFGHSVAIDGASVIVGADNDEHHGDESGSAYTFDLTSMPTFDAEYSCLPAAGTVPFISQIRVRLDSCFPAPFRRIAAHIDVQTARGAFYVNWREGYEDVVPGSSLMKSWIQNIPALYSVIGDNRFVLVAQDVTPAPYNQPPYPPAGDTATAFCVVTAFAP